MMSAGHAEGVGVVVRLQDKITTIVDVCRPTEKSSVSLMEHYITCVQNFSQCCYQIISYGILISV